MDGAVRGLDQLFAALTSHTKRSYADVTVSIRVEHSREEGDARVLVITPAASDAVILELWFYAVHEQQIDVAIVVLAPIDGGRPLQLGTEALRLREADIVAVLTAVASGRLARQRQGLFSRLAGALNFVLETSHGPIVLQSGDRRGGSVSKTWRPAAWLEVAHPDPPSAAD